MLYSIDVSAGYWNQGNSPWPPILKRCRKGQGWTISHEERLNRLDFFCWKENQKGNRWKVSKIANGTKSKEGTVLCRSSSRTMRKQPGPLSGRWVTTARRAHLRTQSRDWELTAFGYCRGQSISEVSERSGSFLESTCGYQIQQQISAPNGLKDQETFSYTFSTNLLCCTPTAWLRTTRLHSPSLISRQNRTHWNKYLGPILQPKTHPPRHCSEPRSNTSEPWPSLINLPQAGTRQIHPSAEPR